MFDPFALFLASKHNQLRPSPRRGLNHRQPVARRPPPEEEAEASAAQSKAKLAFLRQKDRRFWPQSRKAPDPPSPGKHFFFYICCFSFLPSLTVNSRREPLEIPSATATATPPAAPAPSAAPVSPARAEASAPSPPRADSPTPLGTSPRIDLRGSNDRSEAEKERPTQDIIREASAEPERSLGASNIGAEQDKDKSSKVPEQTNTTDQQRQEQQQDQQQQDKQQGEQQPKGTASSAPAPPAPSSPPRTSMTKKKLRFITAAEGKAPAQNPERQMVTRDTPGALQASAKMDLLRHEMSIAGPRPVSCLTERLAARASAP